MSHYNAEQFAVELGEFKIRLERFGLERHEISNDELALLRFELREFLGRVDIHLGELPAEQKRHWLEETATLYTLYKGLVEPAGDAIQDILQAMGVM